MSNTNHQTELKNAFNASFSLLDELDYFIDCLTQGKVVEWHYSSTGVTRTATTLETLSDIADKLLFLRIELEAQQERLERLDEVINQLTELVNEVSHDRM